MVIANYDVSHCVSNIINSWLNLNFFASLCLMLRNLNRGYSLCSLPIVMSAIAFHETLFDFSLSLLVSNFVQIIFIHTSRCSIKRVKDQMVKGDFWDIRNYEPPRPDIIICEMPSITRSIAFHSIPFHAISFHHPTFHCIPFHEMTFQRKVSTLRGEPAWPPLFFPLLLLSSLPPHPLLPLPRDTRISWAFDFQRPSPLITGTSRIYFHTEMTYRIPDP